MWENGSAGLVVFFSGVGMVCLGYYVVPWLIEYVSKEENVDNMDEVNKIVNENVAKAYAEAGQHNPTNQPFRNPIHYGVKPIESLYPADYVDMLQTLRSGQPAPEEFKQSNPVDYIEGKLEYPKLKLNYIPRGDRVIVMQLEIPEDQPGQLATPDSQKKRPSSGIVIAVGPGARNPVTGKIDPIEDLKLGDHIEYLDYAGFTITVDGQEYQSMRQEEIHGKRT